MFVFNCCLHVHPSVLWCSWQWEGRAIQSIQCAAAAFPEILPRAPRPNLNSKWQIPGHTDDLVSNIPVSCLPVCCVDTEVLGLDILIRPGGSWTCSRYPPGSWWSWCSEDGVERARCPKNLKLKDQELIFRAQTCLEIRNPCFTYLVCSYTQQILRP